MRMRQGRGSEATEAVFLPIRQKSLFIPGCVQGCIILIVLSVTFVFFTECESCTRPISTNAGSMGACEYGLTRRTCFVSRRLEVVAVVVLLWLSWCVLGGADFFVFFFRFFFLRTHTACCKYEAALPHSPLLVTGNTRTAAAVVHSTAVRTPYKYKQHNGPYSSSGPLVRKWVVRS